MDRYILILTDTFEEVEALTQVDYLRRADIKVDMISITGKLQVTTNVFKTSINFLISSMCSPVVGSSKI